MRLPARGGGNPLADGSDSTLSGGTRLPERGDRPRSGGNHGKIGGHGKMTPQELKNSILQLAIQGKLVEQRPEEGTAADLFKQIQAEKQSLIKAGKLKKEKSLPPITDDEKPFEIPESWMWVRLRDICTKIIDGDHNPPGGIAQKTEYWMLSAQNISNTGPSNLDQVRYLTKDVFCSENERTKVQVGDIFFTIVATLGRSCVYEGGLNICFQRSVSVITTQIYNYYLKYSLDSSFIQNFMVANATGTAQKGFYLNQVERLLIPLPPLSEQKRIVAKIEELLPLIDRYGVAWSRLEDFNKRFPNDMQKSILQMAIQGKLVEQHPEEGTAEELCNQIQSEKQSLIKAGKLKKEKPLPPITDDEIPFEIPESWKWVRLSQMAQVIVDCPHSTPHYYETPTNFVAIDTNCIDEQGKITGWRYVDEETYKYRIQRLAPQENDIVYTREGSICRAAILPKALKICLGQRVMLIRCPSGGFVQYVKMILMSPQTVAILTQKQKGIGAKHVNVAEVCNLIVPLPPLAEQKRIVAKIEELLPFCENLK